MAAVLSPSSYQWTWFALPPLAVGMISIVLGITIIFRERASRISFVFNLVTLHLSLWLLTRGLIFLSADASLAYFWVKVGNIFVVMIPSSAVVYTLFLVRRLRERLRLAFACLAFSLLSIAAILLTDQFTAGVYRHPWGFASRLGPLSFPFLIFFFVSLVISLWFYWREYRRSPENSLTKIRLRSYFYGLAVALLGSVDFLEVYGIPVYPFGFVPIFAFLVFIARAIWKYRLVNITPSIAAEQVLKTVVDGLLVVDREGMIRLANDAASKIFGKTPAGLIDCSASALGVEIFRKEKIAWLLWDKKVRRHEISYKNNEGESLILEIHASVIQDKNGISVAAIFIVKDVTSSKLAQKKLLESEQQYRLLAENVRDVIWTVDRDLAWTYISPSVEGLTGFRANEALTRTWKETLALSSYDAIMKILKRALEYDAVLSAETEKVETETLELEYQSKNSKTVWTEAKITFLRDEEGRLIHILGVTRDITERRASQKALQSLESHYDELLQMISDPFLTLDRMGYLRTTNPASERILGYSRHEVSGKHFSKTGLFVPQSVDKLLQEFTLVLLGWQRSPFDIHGISRDGIPFVAEATVRLVERASGESHVQMQLKVRSETKPAEASSADQNPKAQGP